MTAPRNDFAPARVVQHPAGALVHAIPRKGGPVMTIMHHVAALWRRTPLGRPSLRAEISAIWDARLGDSQQIADAVKRARHAEAVTRAAYTTLEIMARGGRLSTELAPGEPEPLPAHDFVLLTNAEEAAFAGIIDGLRDPDGPEVAGC